ncbi:MAG: SMC-Scp complex subunit ScpB [Candidatus Paceibacterota bacterium]
MTPEQKLEAILFYKAEPVDIAWLAQFLQIEPGQILQTVNNLKDQLQTRGIQVVTTASKVTLATHKDMADVLDALTKKEEASDLGKAGLETLSLIIYKHPISRAEIDYIRGVNSSFIVRLLTIRGLIERIKNPTDSRGYLYQPTVKLLAWLGLSTSQELPEYESALSKLNNFLTTNDNSSTANE